METGLGNGEEAGAVEMEVDPGSEDFLGKFRDGGGEGDWMTICRAVRQSLWGLAKRMT